MFSLRDKFDIAIKFPNKLALRVKWSNKCLRSLLPLSRFLVPLLVLHALLTLPFKVLSTRVSSSLITRLRLTAIRSLIRALLVLNLALALALALV